MALMLKNARLLDPQVGLDEVADILIRDGRIVEIGHDLEMPKGIERDLSGKIVVPGLVDMHTHIFQGGSQFGFNADLLLPYGVTACVDAGTAGSANYEALHRILAQKQVRAYTFLNISPMGQMGSGLNENLDPALTDEAAQAISAAILAARERQDSVGGITQTAVCGLPAGVGEPWFDSVESLLSHAVFSIGGVKGIEFGGGFSAVCGYGSDFNDSLRMENGRVVTATNRNGGINGGITNGMDVVFQCAVKPTPSIGQPQQTVDFLRGEDAELTIHGRHDPAIIRRICPVLDSVTALVLCDLLTQRFGTDYLAKGAGL